MAALRADYEPDKKETPELAHSSDAESDKFVWDKGRLILRV
jgi:hypothetical protein